MTRAERERIVEAWRGMQPLTPVFAGTARKVAASYEAEIERLREAGLKLLAAFRDPSSLRPNYHCQELAKFEAALQTEEELKK